MIVLGIDPGTARTGFGVVGSRGGTLRALDHGVVSTRRGHDLGARLAQIFEAVRRARRASHRPDAVALETLFVGSNPRTILTVGHARGAALAACGVAGVPSAEYSPGGGQDGGLRLRAGRQGAGGQHGRGDPRAARGGPPLGPRLDALAVAICHAASARTRALHGGAR